MECQLTGAWNQAASRITSRRGGLGREPVDRPQLDDPVAHCFHDAPPARRRDVQRKHRIGTRVGCSEMGYWKMRSVRSAPTELRELHREFLEFGTDVEELVAETVLAIRVPDSAVVALVAGREALAERDRQITERCRRIVLLHQPVAVDFREVTTILRMGAELKHIGDLAVEITERSTALAALSMPVPEELSRMAEVVSGLVRRFLGRLHTARCGLQPTARLAPPRRGEGSGGDTDHGTDRQGDAGGVGGRGTG